jgi:hypothetical protein
MGYYAGMAIGGSNGIFLGSYAGRYETAGAKLILDAFDRTNEANQRAQAVIYGVMSSTAANQILSLGGGGKVGINEIAPPTIFNVGAKLVDIFSYTYDTNSTVLVHQTPTAAATLNDPKNVFLLGRQGTSSQCYAAGAAFMLSRYENDGAPNYGSRTRLDVSLAHAKFDPESNIVMTFLSSKRVGINEVAPDYTLDINGTFGFTPGSSATPVDNGDVTFELTNDTTLTIKAKGSDGTVRSVALTLA